MGLVQLCGGTLEIYVESGSDSGKDVDAVLPNFSHWYNSQLRATGTVRKVAKVGDA
jgi:hypothetical protein